MHFSNAAPDVIVLIASLSPVSVAIATTTTATATLLNFWRLQVLFSLDDLEIFVGFIVTLVLSISISLRALVIVRGIVVEGWENSIGEADSRIHVHLSLIHI